jgi:deoxyribonuclease-4
MEIGVKTFDNLRFLQEFEGKADFFEIMAIDNQNQELIEFLTKTKTPIIIHAQHRGFEVNNADKTKEIKNERAIKTSIELANKVKANKIITHPGELDNNNCSKQNSIDFIKGIGDKRIIVENMPYDNGKRLCSTPENTKSYLKESGAKFCFDVNHAISAALELGLDYIKFIKSFIKLEPVHYHLGGQKINGRDITHLDFKDSEINLKKILELLPKDAKITLEVTTDLDKTKKDLEIITLILKSR